jgi:DNA-directed RNA polymerase specialized sigma24 family protein
MAKRYIPTLECLETRQALAASPSRAGMAAALNPGHAVTVLQVEWAPYVLQSVASAVAAGSSAQVAPSDAPQPPTATSAGNVPAASPLSVAVGSSPRATAPSGAGPENSSSPGWGDETLTANQGVLSKDVPLSQGESAAPTNSASAEDRFPSKADESADRPPAGVPSPRPPGQEAGRPSDAGALPEPTGRQGGDPPKGIGGSEGASSDWPRHLLRVRSATNARNEFSSAPADGLTEETAPLTGALANPVHAKPLEGLRPPQPGHGAREEGLAHFLDRKALQAFFANAWDGPARGAVTVSVAQRPDRQRSGAPEEGTGVTPLVLGAVLVPRGKPLDPVERGYQYLCHYARHSIRAAERRVGPLRDHDDLVQQTCVEWLEQAGPPAEALPRLLEQAPVEMQLLRAVVTRVIARAIYQQKKQSVVLDFNDWPAPGNAVERDWAEFKADCDQGVGNLSRREWQVLDLRRQGKTFEEIGAELRLPRQRVWEVYRAVEARLRRIYGKKDG